ncbi:hybrid sensor histidine kinase/response regulator [Flavobacterium pallidum]|uniref:histidine kinase n=1 Tax=Flavobacterium pallidum TaxID=2172098 RepID=A0A2S1SH36_9FLAO|nr:hybrid sensor histidine kinase/response regulator [Flavobacterium pallidum]AWI25726.1 hybrid sensor histidine kinase/response regulator [Flavobacterium pallidum]
MPIHINTFARSWRISIFCVLLSPLICRPQYVLQKNVPLPEYVSLHQYASLADAGSHDFSIQQVVDGSSALRFLPLKSENTNIGFTKNHYWLKVSIKNDTDALLEYYFETARPVTDLVNLYTIDSKGKLTEMQSGDNIPFKDRSFRHRMPLFPLKLAPHETLRCYLHLKSDGEVINMPVALRSEFSLMKAGFLEQLVFGIFYGILLIAAIIYFFFFFGLKEKSFLYYSSYVFFIGLMQFSLDGYFHQYIASGAGWFSGHSVLIFACFSTFFLGKYTQHFLRIKKYSRKINLAYRLLYILVGILFAVVVFIPSGMEYAYPMANILGLTVLLLIISSVVTIYIKKGEVDGFFTSGVLFLISGFVIFIMNNFSVLPNSFFTTNSSKFGTGLEVIFLSLSMANFIRKLKREREELNRLALVRAEEMSELKSYFLSNISHELRTPLNAIMTMIDAISKEVDDDSIRKNCQVIKYSSYSLLSSINDILDFSKIQKKELQLEMAKFDPAKMLRKISESAAIKAKDQQLHFQFIEEGEFPALVLGDRNRLAQIINNVLNNAFKFTVEGFVRMKAEAVTANGKLTLLMTISDSGVGIAKEKMENIFDSFTQDNINNKRKFGGLGLGLYIVKTLVDMQRGQIEMNSKVGIGSVFKISLEFDVAEDTFVPAAAAKIEDFDLGGKNILVVEDNAINQLVVKTITKKWANTSVTFAGNGEECIACLKNDQFDIILMDLQMPVMDGYEATIAIRNSEAGPENTRIPIIALTADVMEATKTRVNEIGMNGYLSKPLKADTLFEAVRELVHTN